MGGEVPSTRHGIYSANERQNKYQLKKKNSILRAGNKKNRFLKTWSSYHPEIKYKTPSLQQQQPNFKI